ncbi:hypothetical protein H8F21_13280 [Pseudomonas sp. P66]|uniref:Uncharacterized protein n=1 Tax=Pseudomonas arcuscaelestis TaxID=2710591 RepID=A0ABS2BY43_9PSED|nr:hypothetical protein [Pseudomonas arcuscaelestis]MBM5458535.1 hypothetical protein [Pseudomonas arcuscaelestis]
MSQHYLKFFHERSGCDVRVQLGWDRPLQGFYMVALKENQDALPDGDDGVVYSNLYDVGHTADLTHYKEVSKQLDFPIPDVMWRAAYLDFQHNAVNKQVFYDLEGRLVDPY